MALSLIDRAFHNGRILDIGCGSFPLFLSQSPFREKVGLDQVMEPTSQKAWKKMGVTMIGQDLNCDPGLPFPDNHFDVVTMLAVFEHVESDKLLRVIAEIHRVLRPDGIYVLTTPAQWTDPILTVLSRLRLLSPAEVEEHQETHSHGSILDILTAAGFPKEKVEQGTFELGMNLWVRATKGRKRVSDILGPWPSPCDKGKS